MTSPLPITNWPKAWLLQVMARAVEEGMIWLDPFRVEDVHSFTMRFYRIRRRSDKSMAAFIPPEYHLVTVGEPEQSPTDPGLCRLPIIYSARPDGIPVPAIVSATPEEKAQLATPTRAPLSPPAELHLDPAQLEIKPEEIGGFVEQLRRQARERNQ